MSNLYDRIRSFKMWPKQMAQRKKDLAKAGYYYSGYGDLVICSGCGARIRGWKPHDDVNIQHMQCSIDCIYFKKIFSSKYIGYFFDNYDSTTKC